MKVGSLVLIKNTDVTGIVTTIKEVGSSKHCYMQYWVMTNDNGTVYPFSERQLMTVSEA